MATATFYSQIAANRRNSVLLSLVVVLLLGALGFAIGGAVGGSVNYGLAGAGIALVAGFAAAFIAYYAGDALVLASSGAREVDANSAPQLFNVVGEMAVAAGVPMPRVYIIDDTAPNAFATGRDPQHASVAITVGLLQKLDREELQGVMGHELSHVRNFDIRFSLMVGVLVGAVALISDMFLRMTFWGSVTGGRRRRSSDGDSGGFAAVMMIIALVLAILAPIFAKLVQLAVSRQREYLADASSVELTRNPYGLQRALAKISLDTEPLEAANRATQHLYFENPVKAAASGDSDMFSTHPAVLDRINRLRELTGEQPVGDPRQVVGETAPVVNAQLRGLQGDDRGSDGPPPPPPPSGPMAPQPPPDAPSDTPPGFQWKGWR
ncbi:MAG: zinc metalloprotease HtpX [Chloroflexota bacterium]